MALDYLPTPSWSVVYGETPSASKWSELGANDDALATGAGIDDLAILTRHIADGGDGVGVTGAKLGTPVAFFAHRSTAHNVTSSFTDLICNSEGFDYGGNYNASTGIFTAPYNGVYFFAGMLDVGSGTTPRALLQFSTTGTTTIPSGQMPDYEMTRVRNIHSSVIGYMEAGATVKLQKFATTTIDCASTRTFFTGALIGRS